VGGDQRLRSKTACWPKLFTRDSGVAPAIALQFNTDQTQWAAAPRRQGSSALDA